MGKNLTNEEFIIRSRKVHGNKYDYSKTNYIDNYTKVCIICSKHGEFFTTPNAHKKGKNCPKCSIENVAKKQTFTNEEFIIRSRKVHGNKYNYDKVNYINSKIKVCIICSKHGEFWQIPSSHFKGIGCSKCSKLISSKKRKKTKEDFLKEAIKIHGNKYDYSITEYINATLNIKYICPIHGIITQKAQSHLKYGCLFCSKKNKKSKNEFILELKNKYKNKFNYEKVKYKNNKTYVDIICNNCGNIFSSRPDNLLSLNIKCPNCEFLTNGTSKQENEIKNFIKSLNIKFIENTKNIIPPYELDIYIPEKNLAIEFNGLYWHSQQILEKRNQDGKKYHLNKSFLCEINNIRLIHIFEDEWLYKKEIVKNRLKSILGIYNNRIGGRECEINEIETNEKNIFLEKYHIQGTDKSSIKLGAFYKKTKKLISVMTFCKPRIALGKKSENNKYELSRFVTIADTLTPGIASKLLNYFIKKYKPKEIYTYSDKRWNTGNLYKKLGFEFDYNSQLNYWYIIKRKRIHRFNFRKQKLNQLLENFSENLTEYENMLNNNIDRIFDCGNQKWKKIF